MEKRKGQDKIPITFHRNRGGGVMCDRSVCANITRETSEDEICWIGREIEK